MDIPGYVYDGSKNRYFRVGRDASQSFGTGPCKSSLETYINESSDSSTSPSLWSYLRDREYDVGLLRNDYFEYWRFGKKRFSNEISKDLFIKDIKLSRSGGVLFACTSEKCAGRAQAFDNLEVYRVTARDQGQLDVLLLKTFRLKPLLGQLYVSFHLDQSMVSCLYTECDNRILNIEVSLDVVESDQLFSTVRVIHKFGTQVLPAKAIAYSSWKHPEYLLALAYPGRHSKIAIYPIGTKLDLTASSPLSLCFTKSGDLLCGLRNGVVLKWTRQQLYQRGSLLPAAELQIPGSGSAVVNLMAPQDGSSVVTHSMNGQLSLWSVTQRREIWCYVRARENWASVSGYQDRGLSALSSEGMVLAAIDERETNVVIWSVFSGRQLNVIFLNTLQSHCIASIDFVDNLCSHTKQALIVGTLSGFETVF